MSKPEVLEIVKEDDEFVYIHRADASPQNLIAFREHMLTVPGKHPKDIDTDMALVITTTPNVGYTFRPKDRKPKISKAMLKKAIMGCEMPTQAAISRALHCNYMTVRKYLDKYDMWSLMDRRRFEAVDSVEDKLLEIARTGNVKAIETFLAANYPEKYGKGNTQSQQDVSVKILFETPPEKGD